MPYWDSHTPVTYFENVIRTTSNLKVTVWQYGVLCVWNMVVTPFIQDLRRLWRARNLRMKNLCLQSFNMTGQPVTVLDNRQHCCPSHSSELTPPDAYIWGMLKEKVLMVQTRPELIIIYVRWSSSFSGLCSNLWSRICLKIYGIVMNSAYNAMAHILNMYYKL